MQAYRKDTVFCIVTAWLPVGRPRPAGGEGGNGDAANLRAHPSTTSLSHISITTRSNQRLRITPTDADGPSRPAPSALISVIRGHFRIPLLLTCCPGKAAPGEAREPPTLFSPTLQNRWTTQAQSAQRILAAGSAHRHRRDLTAGAVRNPWCPPQKPSSLCLGVSVVHFSYATEGFSWTDAPAT